MNTSKPSPFIYLSRAKWAALRNSEPLTLTTDELTTLKGIDEELSIEEVEDIYLPLSRLLSYYINARSSRHTVLMKFLKEKEQVNQTPFIIGVAGSVSVGKSTTSRVLQALLSRWGKDTKVALVNTDGFLYPNSVLTEKGIMLKKGFPQSYDIAKIIQFVQSIKAGEPKVEVPVYSHALYDIVPGKYATITQPDILILEGLNVLQSGGDYPPQEHPRVFVSDYLDFSIYVDAEEKDLEEWYLSRFMKFRSKAIGHPTSYFHNFTSMSEEEATKTAQSVWREINRTNLRENIIPTRVRANLILHKGTRHKVDYVKLRK